jgi:hypothetical protein
MNNNTLQPIPAPALRYVSNNCHYLIFKDYCIIFSYGTPVAAVSGGKYWRVDQFYSATTTKHIYNFLAGNPAENLSTNMFARKLWQIMA